MKFTFIIKMVKLKKNLSRSLKNQKAHQDLFYFFLFPREGNIIVDEV